VRTFLSVSITKKKKQQQNDSVEKMAVKKAYHHSDVDMFAPALQFTGIMSTDEVFKITLL